MITSREPSLPNSYSTCRQDPQGETNAGVSLERERERETTALLRLSSNSRYDGDGSEISATITNSLHDGRSLGTDGERVHSILDVAACRRSA